MKAQPNPSQSPCGAAFRATRRLVIGGGLGVFIVSIVASGMSIIHPVATVPNQRPVAQVDATSTNLRVQHNASHPAAALSRANGRSEDGFECASLRCRVAPSRVFSELIRSAERLVALDPIARRQHRILVAKRSLSQTGLSSAILIGAGQGAIVPT